MADSKKDALDGLDLGDGLGDSGEEALEEDEGSRTFTVGGKTIEVRFTKQRLNLYEQRHTPIMASFIKNDGALSLAELQAILAYSLKFEGGGYLNPRKGDEVAERLIEANGYGAVFECVFEALQRDCGFLFKEV